MKRMVYGIAPLLLIFILSGCGPRYYLPRD